MVEQNITLRVLINLGCGNHPPKGWVNVDYSLGARFAKLPLFNIVNRKLKFFTLEWDHDILIHDLRKPFPWDDCSIDVIYSSHTLEHFTQYEGRTFLQECHRVLKNNGLIRILVPDLQAIVLQYLDEKLPVDEFIERRLIRYDKGGDGWLRRLFAPLFRFPHKCMYDTKSLLQLMKELGFNVSPQKPFKSEIPEIQQIELAGRTGGVVIVEGRKTLCGWIHSKRHRR